MRHFRLPLSTPAIVTIAVAGFLVLGTIYAICTRPPRVPTDEERQDLRQEQRNARPLPWRGGQPR